MNKGLKHDNGKLRWDLLPLNRIKEVVKVYTFGANKELEYAKENNFMVFYEDIE